MNQKYFSRSVLRYLFTLTACFAAVSAPAESKASEPKEFFLPPDVVPTVDLQKYSGTWYEIASTRPPFQEDCFCTSAQYTVLNSSELGVLNSCRRGSAAGELDSVTGTAKVPDLGVPAKLKVNFGGPELPFTNYWIVSLASDYSYAVVSSAFKTPIFILARERNLPADTLATVVADLERRGFNTTALDFGIQSACSDQVR